jgi:hypothetical protein
MTRQKAALHPRHVSVTLYRGTFMQSHRMARLDSTLGVGDISYRLSLNPVCAESSDGKVTIMWQFVANGHECAIWDYKGARWSLFGPRDIFESLFPGHVGD